MKTAIAIGGGHLQDGETQAFDQLAIQRSGKKEPTILLIPAASRDDQGYAKRFKQYFRSLGCRAKSLRLWHTKKTIDEVKAEIKACDILYLGAGDTSLLMDALHTWDLMGVIQERYERGCVIMGISAGANVLFTKGYSDTSSGYRFVDGMGIIEGLYCPHAQKEERNAFVNCAATLGINHVYPCADCTAYVKLDDQSLQLMKQGS